MLSENNLRLFDDKNMLEKSKISDFERKSDSTGPPTE